MVKTFQDHFCVLDLETLGSRDDAVILSLGLTVSRYDETHKTFDDLVKEGLYLKFDIKEQLARGRKTQDRVVQWWYKQDMDARRVLIPSANDVSLYALPAYLTTYFTNKDLSARNIDWYDRKSFDMSKLQYMFEEEMGGDVPWRPTQEFEVATAFRFLGMDRYAGIQVKDIPGAIYHNALHDAAVDHLRMFKALHTIQG
jgi:hypothetical protein